MPSSVTTCEVQESSSASWTSSEQSPWAGGVRGAVVGGQGLDVHGRVPAREGVDGQSELGKLCVFG